VTVQPQPEPGSLEPSNVEVIPPRSLFPDLPALKVTRWRPKLTVEAVHLDGESDWEAVAAWCGGRTLIAGAREGHESIGVPTTYAGIVHATAGNWIVKGLHGFMVYEAAAFAAVYQAAEDGQ
jgi:hypothetical protein